MVFVFNAVKRKSLKILSEGVYRNKPGARKQSKTKARSADESSTTFQFKLWQMCILLQSIPSLTNYLRHTQFEHLPVALSLLASLILLALAAWQFLINHPLVPMTEGHTRADLHAALMALHSMPERTQK